MNWSLRPVLVHCLSDEARQLAFVNMSDLADLHSMTPAERKIITPFTSPFIRVSAKGEELSSRCLNRNALSVSVEEQHEGEDGRLQA